MLAFTRLDIFRLKIIQILDSKYQPSLKSNLL